MQSNNKARLQQWIDNGNRLSILVTGKTGVGKSALINGIVGEEIAKEGGIEINEGRGVTEAVTPKQRNIRGIPVIVIDSPGFQDRHQDPFAQIQDHLTNDLNLVLYCINMTNARIEENEIQTMQKLSEQFPYIWSKTVFVLTQANRYRYRGDMTNKPQLIKAFNGKLNDFKNAILTALVTAGHPREDITVVPAGYYCSCPQDINPNDQWYLPGYEDDWLSILWAKCANKLVGEPLLAMVGMASHRFVPQGTTMNGNQQIHDRQIVINRRNHDFKEIAAKMGSMGGKIGLVAGGIVGGALGFLGGISGPLIVHTNHETHVLTGPIANIISGVMGMLSGTISGSLIFGLIGAGCGALIGYTIWGIFLGGRLLMSTLRFW